MNYNHIHYFITIVEEGSISAASRRLFISQQALSEQLKKLEKELNVTLFKRNNKLVLTPAGHHFYEGCVKMFAYYDSLVEELHSMENERYKLITVGFPEFGYPAFLSPIISSYMKKNPDCQLNFVKRDQHDVSVRLEGVDLYISPNPIANNLENHIILEDDTFCVTFRKSLAKRIYKDKWPHIEKSLITTGDISVLQQIPFSLIHNSRRELLHSTKLIFVEHNFDPITKYLSETIDASDLFCLNGLAAIISPISHIAVAFYNNPAVDSQDLLSYPLKITNFTPMLAISHLKTHGLHDAELLFIKECRNYFKSIKMPALPIR